MSLTRSWMIAEIPGPTRANVITKPEIVVALIRRHKRPLLVVGSRIATDVGEESMADYVIRLAKAANIPILASLPALRVLREKGFEPIAAMPLADIGARLVDPSWQGVDGKGPHDLLLVLGFRYYEQWLLLSGVKHFSDTTLISLDYRYQPHAKWSFLNISLEDWKKNLKAIIEKLSS